MLKLKKLTNDYSEMTVCFLELDFSSGFFRWIRDSLPLLYPSIEDVALEVESCMDEVNPVKLESLSPWHHRKLLVS